MSAPYGEAIGPSLSLICLPSVSGAPCRRYHTLAQSVKPIA
jgi:hypothetical protein